MPIEPNDRREEIEDIVEVETPYTGIGFLARVGLRTVDELREDFRGKDAVCT